MSSIASFRILPSNKVSALLVAAVPEVRISRHLLLFKKSETVARLPAFLRSEAEELVFRAGSGNCFVVLDLFYVDGTSNSFIFPDNTVSAKLSEALGTTVAFFDLPSAQTALTALQGKPPDKRALEAFVEEEYRDTAASAEPILAAYQTLTYWLGLVDQQHVGLLTIG